MATFIKAIGRISTARPARTKPSSKKQWKHASSESGHAIFRWPIRIRGLGHVVGQARTCSIRGTIW